VVPFIVMPATFWITHVLRSRDMKHQAEFLAALASRDLCRSCGYELRGLPIDNDGCASCPECNAAWRISVLAASVSLLTPEEVEMRRRAVAAVIDAKGVAQPVCALSNFHDPALTREAASRSLLARIGWTIVSCAMFAVCLAGLHRSLPGLGLAFSGSAYWTSLVIVVASSLGVLAAGRFFYDAVRPSSQLHAARVALAIIEAGRCPACTSELLPVDPANMHRTCVRCRAVWHTLRIPKRLWVGAGWSGWATTGK
jgi:predicted Zn-ribbon and HTH transcriptional regulator